MDGSNERWFECVARVVEGTFDMQKAHAERFGRMWDESTAQMEAQEMYRRMFWMKFLPPGRGLWAMGSPLTRRDGGRAAHAALNNCAFVSTERLERDPSAPFAFLMD